VNLLNLRSETLLFCTDLPMMILSAESFCHKIILPPIPPFGHSAVSGKDAQDANDFYAKFLAIVAMDRMICPDFP
jgi:hypothetical protein